MSVGVRVLHESSTTRPSLPITYDMRAGHPDLFFNQDRQSKPAYPLPQRFIPMLSYLITLTLSSFILRLSSTPESDFFRTSRKRLCLLRDLNPHSFWELDFESSASTNSTKKACDSVSPEPGFVTWPYSQRCAPPNHLLVSFSVSPVPPEEAVVVSA